MGEELTKAGIRDSRGLDDGFLRDFPWLWLEYRAYTTFSRCGNKTLAKFYEDQIRLEMRKDIYRRATEEADMVFRRALNAARGIQSTPERYSILRTVKESVVNLATKVKRVFGEALISMVSVPCIFGIFFGQWAHGIFWKA